MLNQKMLRTFLKYGGIQVPGRKIFYVVYAKVFISASKKKLRKQAKMFPQLKSKLRVQDFSMTQQLKLGVCNIKCYLARNNVNFPEFSSGTGAIFSNAQNIFTCVHHIFKSATFL